MKNTFYEGRYVSPEEIKEYVLAKFSDANDNPTRYHEFCIDSCLGFSKEKSDELSDVVNAIIAIKHKTDVFYIRVVDGKVIGPRPDEFYLVYKPGKTLACGLRQSDNETFIRIKEGDECSVDFNITVFMMIHYIGGLFTLLYSPDTAKFTEPFFHGSDEEVATFMRSIKRFFHLPSNFRSLAKEESEDDNE